jgi:hypothetical protein
MRILVIGGTGFSGPHVVRCVAAMGHEVVLLHQDLQLTSGAYWLSAAVSAALAVVFVAWLARRVRPERFQRLRWSIVLAAALFWMTYGLLLFCLTWESFYARFLPDPSHRSLSRAVLELLPYPTIGLALWWLALRLPGRPAVTFCLLGGLEALPEHLWGIYRLGMLERVPFLEGVSAVSVLAFAVPEYVLYWGTVLSLALLLEEVWGRLWSRGGSRTRKEAD